MREVRNEYKDFAGKSEGRGQLSRARFRRGIILK
jgi:hypothetical protein